MLNWSQADLANAAGVGQSTVAKFEHGARIPHRGNLTAIRAALEAAGIVFTDGDDTIGPGVHLREPQRR